MDDLDALGAQYREAKAAIATHRQRQATKELALARLRRRLPEDHPDVSAARAAVVKAHADVRWCQGATIAAGEAYKGVTLDQVPHDRNVVPDPIDVIARMGAR